MIVEKVRSVTFKTGKNIQEKVSSRKTSSSRAVDAHLKKQKSKTYNQTLIETLKDENKELLVRYSNIMKHARSGEYEYLPELLNEYTMLLIDHIHKEDAELNYYLDSCFKKGLLKAHLSDALEGYDDFRYEMKEKTIEIEYMVNHSKYIPVTSRTVYGFLTEFKEIGDMLIKRIYNEETILYPLYMDMNPYKISVK
ncbi:hypothetical protein GQR58_010612 [Nymphon striatum]|nr:hypothetical protein GQR58_010612 [Nymphon striatum]